MLFMFHHDQHNQSTQHKQPQTMKSAITAVVLCCVSWSIQESTSFFTARGLIAAPGPTTIGATRQHSFLTSTTSAHSLRYISRHRPCLQQQQQQCVVPSMSSDTDEQHARSSWITTAASAVVAISLSVCAIVTPTAANAEQNAPREPIVQALVQLSNEDSDWKT